MKGIEIIDLTKRFGDNLALNDVNLKLEENTIYGLLGRNGAGKSTLLNIITNRIFADKGQVFIDGVTAVENDEAQRKIYLMSEKTLYPEKMKIRETLNWSKNFYPEFDEAYAKKIANQFELNLNQKVGSLSTGYTSIFKLIIALSVNTPYVFLDEPVLGLDANHRELFYRLLIEKYSERPSTIVISTHLIEEVSGVIENIIIMKRGSIIRNETREELLSRGYTVSGTSSVIDKYIIGKEVIGVDNLGGLKTAYILGKMDKEIPEGIEISKLDLQKLFIQLTNA